MMQWSYYCIPKNLRYEEINLLCKSDNISATHNYLIMKNLFTLKLILLGTEYHFAYSIFHMKILYPFTPQHQSAYSSHCSLYISKGADKENLSINQKLLQLVIIYFILGTLLFDSGVILYGETSSYLLVGGQRDKKYLDFLHCQTHLHPQPLQHSYQCTSSVTN